MAPTMLRALTVACVAATTALAMVLAPAATAVGPAGAWAAFTGTRSAALQASTYAIPAPAGLAADFVCSLVGQGVTATVLGFGSVDRATSYVITLTAPDGTSSSTTVLVPGPAVLSQSSQHKGNRVYTLSVRARIGTWTGAPATRTHRC